MKKKLQYFIDSFNELKLVTWPSQEKLIQLTIITVVFIVIMSIILGIVDFSFMRLYQAFIAFAS